MAYVIEIISASFRRNEASVKRTSEELKIPRKTPQDKMAKYDLKRGDIFWRIYIYDPLKGDGIPSILQMLCIAYHKCVLFANNSVYQFERCGKILECFMRGAKNMVCAT